MEIQIKTAKKQGAVDITEKVQELIKDKEGKFCLVYCGHTTAGLLINEGADSDVISDILKRLDELIPENRNYRHREGNSPAHIKSSLIGNFVLVPVENGKLKLGTWQKIFFLEFDGPRDREVEVVVV